MAHSTRALSGLAAALIVVAPLLTATSCSPSVTCHISAQPPTGKGGKMIATGRITCSGGDVDDVVLHIEIEKRRRNGDWGTWTGGPVTRRIGSVPDGATKQGQATWICGTGHYRTVVTGSGVYKGKPNGSFGREASTPAENPCG